MNIQERLVDWFESMYLGLVLALTVSITVALLQPHVVTERKGVVEVYSLVSADATNGTI